MVSIISGFIEGILFAHDIDATAQTRKSVYPELLNKLESRSEEYIKHIDSAEYDANEWYMENSAEREQDLQYIIEVLEKNGITYGDATLKWMASLIRSELVPSHDSDLYSSFDTITDVTDEQIIRIEIKIDWWKNIN